ncbi:unnamed protein product [Ambrosiozyma monospora]|uniref:Unnamed protein product n=1 Tax=Ambrosiozyma monospora TaxID=43982 RepID=A0A9W7DKM1_AMBMO|nr:unnamed protein product [Ambrosiozyma monospora]
MRTLSSTLIDTENFTFTIDDFQSALSILEEIIMEQIGAERKKIKDEQIRTGRKVTIKDINQSYLDTLQKMIDLLPVFKNLYSFYSVYSHFVAFLEEEKKRYLHIYNSD